MEELRIGVMFMDLTSMVMFDTINTLNDICFIDEFDKVMTNKFSIMYATHKITDTLLKLNVLLINKRYIVFLN